MKIQTLTLTLEEKSSIYKQLFDYIKENIITGRFSPGDTLPSSRNLAHDLSISRNSVLNAYNALIAEGYVISYQGAGYRINERPVEQPEDPRRESLISQPNQMRYVPFNPEPIDTSFFPAHKWAKIMSRIARTASLSLVNTSLYDNQGSRELRDVLREYLYEKKGIVCKAEQIAITTGSMESLEVCVNAITKPGHMVGIEDPCYPSLRHYLIQNHRQIFPVPVDREGACCDDIPEECHVVIVTPGNQFPLGTTMSVERKHALSEWANQRKAWLIEDDYDSDFNFNHQKSAALTAVDSHKRTFYLGNFSKLITTDLRIGFVVIPEELLPEINKLDYTFKVSYLPQLILAEFIRTGDFYRNLLKARSVYSDKRDFFISLLQHELSSYGHVYGDPAGSLIVFELLPEIDDCSIMIMAQDKLLSLRALSQLCHNERRNGLVMGYLYFNRDVLRKAVHTLKGILALYHSKNIKTAKFQIIESSASHAS